MRSDSDLSLFLCYLALFKEVLTLKVSFVSFCLNKMKRNFQKQDLDFAH